MKTRLKFALPLTLALAVSACMSGGDDWPNLSDPLPDPANRNRVTERAEPTAPSRPDDPAPSTEEAAMVLVGKIKAALLAEQDAYFRAKEQFEAAAQETKQDTWLAAQIALTRLSHTLSRIEPITERNDPESPAWTHASNIWADFNAFLITERRYIMAAQPE